MFNDSLYNDSLFNDVISLGQTGYSRGSYLSLPTGTADLLYSYSAQDYFYVSTKNGMRVLEGDSNKYVIHQFKNSVGLIPSCKIEWYGRATLAPADSIVFLQVYNVTTGLWVTIDSNGSTESDIDFTLTSDMGSLVDYKDINGIICCRVYQFMS